MQSYGWHRPKNSLLGVFFIGGNEVSPYWMHSLPKGIIFSQRRRGILSPSSLKICTS